MADLRSEVLALRSKLAARLERASQLAATLEHGQAAQPVGERVRKLGARDRAEALPIALAVFGGAEPGAAIAAVLASETQAEQAGALPRIHGWIRQDSLPPIAARVTLAADPAAASEDPAALGQLLDDAGLLVVAAPAGWHPGAADHRALQLLCGAATLVWPLALGERGADDGPGWWTAPVLRGRCGQIPGAVVEPGERPGAMAAPLAPVPGLAPLLAATGVARELEAATQILADQHEVLVARTLARSGAAARRATSLDEAARRLRDARAELDPIRDQVQSRLTALLGEIQEANRKALLPGGALRARAAHGLADLSRADLREEPGETAIRVTLHESFASRLDRDARETVRDALSADLRRIRDGLAEIERETCAALDRVTGEPTQLDAALPDARGMQQSLEEMIEVETRYRGELPKRGLMQRIMAGRRAAFMVLIMFSLFGGSFSLRRSPIFPVLMGSLFAGGVAYTFVSWKRQEDERVEKELARLRDGLDLELRRMHGEVQREKLSRLSTHVSDVQKAFQREIDRVARDTAARRLERVEAERSELRSRLKVLEARARSTQAHGAEIARLRDDSEKLREEIARAVAAALRPLAPRGARS